MAKQKKDTPAAGIRARREGDNHLEAKIQPAASKESTSATPKAFKRARREGKNHLKQFQ